MLHIKFTSHAFDRLRSEVCVLTLFSDQKPFLGSPALVDWRLNGRLSRLMMREKFEGHLDEVLLMPSEGRLHSPEIMIFGLGATDDFNESLVSHFTHSLLQKLAQKKVRHFSISYSDLIPDRFEWRNSIRLLVSKLHDYPVIESVNLCETDECVRDAKKRHMDFGMNVEVSFETTES